MNWVFSLRLSISTTLGLVLVGSCLSGLSGVPSFASSSKAGSKGLPITTSEASSVDFDLQTDGGSTSMSSGGSPTEGGLTPSPRYYPKRAGGQDLSGERTPSLLQRKSSMGRSSSSSPIRRRSESEFAVVGSRPSSDAEISEAIEAWRLVAPGVPLPDEYQPLFSWSGDKTAVDAKTGKVVTKLSVEFSFPWASYFRSDVKEDPSEFERNLNKQATRVLRRLGEHLAERVVRALALGKISPAVFKHTIETISNSKGEVRDEFLRERVTHILDTHASVGFAYPDTFRGKIGWDSPIVRDMLAKRDEYVQAHRLLTKEIKAREDYLSVLDERQGLAKKAVEAAIVPFKKGPGASLHAAIAVLGKAIKGSEGQRREELVREQTLKSQEYEAALSAYLAKLPAPKGWEEEGSVLGVRERREQIGEEKTKVLAEIKRLKEDRNARGEATAHLDRELNELASKSIEGSMHSDRNYPWSFGSYANFLFFSHDAHKTIGKYLAELTGNGAIKFKLYLVGSSTTARSATPKTVSGGFAKSRSVEDLPEAALFRPVGPHSDRDISVVVTPEDFRLIQASMKGLVDTHFSEHPNPQAKDAYLKYLDGRAGRSPPFSSHDHDVPACSYPGDAAGPDYRSVSDLVGVQNVLTALSKRKPNLGFDAFGNRTLQVETGIMFFQHPELKYVREVEAGLEATPILLPNI